MEEFMCTGMAWGGRRTRGSDWATQDPGSKIHVSVIFPGGCEGAQGHFYCSLWPFGPVVCKLLVLPSWHCRKSEFVRTPVSACAGGPSTPKCCT